MFLPSFTDVFVHFSFFMQLYLKHSEFRSVSPITELLSFSSEKMQNPAFTSAVQLRSGMSFSLFPFFPSTGRYPSEAVFCHSTAKNGMLNRSVISALIKWIHAETLLAYWHICCIYYLLIFPHYIYFVIIL